MLMCKRNVIGGGMDLLISQLERYLHDTLSVSVNLLQWAKSKGLPFFLQDDYTFYTAKILNLPFLLMVDPGDKEPSPAIIRKHMIQVQAKWDAEVIYVRERVTPYNRKRLITQKVPFIIPGNQLYLPMLGIDLREHFRKIHRETPKFSPATQVVLLHVLLRDTEIILTPKKLTKLLRYSAMTMTRVFNELEAVRLGEVFREGRDRNLRFTDEGKDLWTKALPFLQNPIRQCKHFHGISGIEKFAPRAGLAALSHYTMIAEPIIPGFAITREKWQTYKKKQNIVVMNNPEPETTEIQVWNYDPTLFAREGVVDPLSLFLTLRDVNDERVKAALEEMMKEIKW